MICMFPVQVCFFVSSEFMKCCLSKLLLEALRNIRVGWSKHLSFHALRAVGSRRCFETRVQQLISSSHHSFLHHHIATYMLPSAHNTISKQIHTKLIHRQYKHNKPQTMFTFGTLSISEISSCCFGPRPWHIEIRHRVKKHPQLICSDLRLTN